MLVARGRKQRAIEFKTIRCLKCGGMRIMALPCAECGATPPLGEVNSAVVTRRSLVRRIEGRIQDLASGPGDLDDLEPHHEVLDFVKLFVGNLARLLADPRDEVAEVEFAGTIDRLDRLTQALRDLSAKRPSGRFRAYLAVAEELGRLWPIYSEALTADSMDVAQAASRRGQAVLDSSTDSLPAIAKSETAVAILADVRAESSVLKRSLKSITKLNEEMSFADLVALGQREAQKYAPFDVGPGGGVEFLLTSMLADVYLDPSVMDLKRTEIASLASNIDRIVEVSAMQDAIRDIGIARRDLYECLNQFALVEFDATSEGSQLRRFVKTIGDLYEAALPFLAWARLLSTKSTGNDRYSRLVKQNSTSLVLDLAKQFPLTFGDLPSFMRNAAHHGRSIDIDVDAGEVHFRLKSYEESMSIRDYVDHAYAVIESLLALSWIINSSFEAAKLEIDLPAGFSDELGLSVPELAAVWLSVQDGTHVVRSEVVDGRWILTADFQPDSALSVGITLASMDMDGVKVVEVSSLAARGEPLSVPLSVYEDFERSMAGEESSDFLMAVLDLKSRVAFGDMPALTAADLKFAIAFLGARLLGGDLTQVGNLRTLRRYAIELDEFALSDLAVTAISAIRSPSVRDSVLADLRAVSRESPEPPALPSADAVLVFREL
ncbi:hypothetical protein AAEP80_07855 [Curtobacterium sp. L3-7]|uniref:hypothetical protein n=1 Tax=Curtobacterium sp. L3-7 TaxID=3138787 RepID=UPI003B521BC2